MPAAATRDAARPSGTRAARADAAVEAGTLVWSTPADVDHLRQHLLATGLPLTWWLDTCDERRASAPPVAVKGMADVRGREQMPLCAVVCCTCVEWCGGVLFCFSGMT